MIFFIYNDYQEDYGGGYKKCIKFKSPFLFKFYMYMYQDINIYMNLQICSSNNLNHDCLFYLPLKLQCRSVSKIESFPGSRLESTSSSFRSLLFLDFPKYFCRQLLLLINWLGYSFNNIPVIVTLGGVPFNTHMCVCAVCKHFSIYHSKKTPCIYNWQNITKHRVL